jgi:hypothetical protein
VDVIATDAVATEIDPVCDVVTNDPVCALVTNDAVCALVTNEEVSIVVPAFIA